jgi:hypothetical protein
MTRVSGYVSGSYQTPDRRTVWSVVVKDSESKYNGQRLVVASVHGGLVLARGLNVHFAIGTVDDASRTKVPRAVDVNLAE